MQLLILIGLSGSGKTTYYNEYLNGQYKFYDDFISNIIDGKLINDLRKKEGDICIADPRLCNYQTFMRVMKIIEEIIDKKDIQLILFENDKNKCLINATKRGKRNVNKSIEFNSMIYNVENYFDYEIREIREIMTT